MAQIASRGGGTPFGSGVVTVAELLSRNPMSRQVGPGSQTAIPVGALLRREGRTSPALDEVDAGTALTARVHARRTTARRGAIAAGALLAAGSVVGAAVVNGILSAPAPASDQSTPASTPATGAIGDAAQAPVQAAAPLTTLGQEAHVSPLAAGASAPTSWMNVAFPDTVHAPSGHTSAAGKARSGSVTTDSSGTGSTTAGSSTAGSSTAGSTQGSTAGSTDPAGTQAGQAASTPALSVATTQPTGDSVTGRLGGAVTGLGSGTPLAPVTNVVGGVVTGLGEALGALVHGGTAK